MKKIMVYILILAFMSGCKTLDESRVRDEKGSNTFIYFHTEQNSGLKRKVIISVDSTVVLDEDVIDDSHGGIIFGVKLRPGKHKIKLEIKKDNVVFEKDFFVKRFSLLNGKTKIWLTYWPFDKEKISFDIEYSNKPFYIE